MGEHQTRWCSGTLFFLAPVLRSSWRWWQSWMNDVFVHQMLYSKKGGIPSGTNSNKTAPNNKHKNQNKKPRYSPWCETVKQALSDVNPALSTSLPTNGSTELSTPLVSSFSAYHWCLWWWAISSSSFGSSAFFKVIVCSGFLKCDIHWRSHPYWWSPRCAAPLRPHRQTR